MSKLADTLFSKTQQQVLGLLYGNPDKSFYFNEIRRAAGMGVANIKLELERMEDAGILQRVKIGNQQHYQAEPLCPIYTELRSIVTKTLGLADVIAQGLKTVEQKIDLAFIFGSVAKNTENAGSDIDLMLVGKITLEEFTNAFYPLQEKLGRYINPRIYNEAEWHELLNEHGGFIKDVIKNPRLDLIGSTNELG